MSSTVDTAAEEAMAAEAKKWDEASRRPKDAKGVALDPDLYGPDGVLIDKEGLADRKELPNREVAKTFEIGAEISRERAQLQEKLKQLQRELQEDIDEIYYADMQIIALQKSLTFTTPNREFISKQLVGFERQKATLIQSKAGFERQIMEIQRRLADLESSQSRAA